MTEFAAPAPPAPPSSHRRPSSLARAWRRFITDPASARNAIIVIIAANLTTVVVGALIIWLVDRQEFEQFPKAVWYILQTVTTVGYGDVTPTETAGRLVGSVVMLLGIAFVSIQTAMITSVFIDARQSARRQGQDEDEGARWTKLNERLDDMIARLDRLETGRPGESDPTPR